MAVFAVSFHRVPIRKTPLLKAIISIVLMGSNKQMAWVYAFRIVAVVTN